MSKSTKTAKAPAKRTPALSRASAAARPPAGLRANSQSAEQPKKPSKQFRVIEMLRSPKGITLDAIMKATDWQQHSVRGFLAGVVRKRLKLKLDSRLVDGKRMYRIAGAVSTERSRPQAKAR